MTRCHRQSKVKVQKFRSSRTKFIIEKKHLLDDSSVTVTEWQLEKRKFSTYNYRTNEPPVIVYTYPNIVPIHIHHPEEHMHILILLENYPESIFKGETRYSRSQLILIPSPSFSLSHLPSFTSFFHLPSFIFLLPSSCLLPVVWSSRKRKDQPGCWVNALIFVFYTSQCTLIPHRNHPALPSCLSPPPADTVLARVAIKRM